MVAEESTNPMEREISSVQSSSGGAGEPSSSASSSSVAVAGDQTNAQEDARNNGELFPIPEVTAVGNSENCAAAAEEKHRCYICENEFKTNKALCGHMRTHPRTWTGVKPPATEAAAAAAEKQGRDVRESAVAERRGRSVRESAAAQQISPARKSVRIDPSAEGVKRRAVESVVDQLLFLLKGTLQQPQGGDGGSTEGKIASDNSTAGVGSGSGSGSGEVIMEDAFNEPANISVVAAGTEAVAGAGVVVGGVVTAACSGTPSDGKKGTSSKNKGRSSRSSTRSFAAGGSGVHACEICGRTFATGQSLGGHKRKHFEGTLSINKKRARDQREAKPAPAAARRAQEPDARAGHALATTAAVEERMASNFDALLSRSVQASGGGGDCARNREEPEVPLLAGNGARRLHALDLKEPAGAGEEPENAPQPEPERKDGDGDDALLVFRLWPL